MPSSGSPSAPDEAGAPAMPLPSAGHDAGTADAGIRRRPQALLTAIFCGFAALLPVVSVVAPKGLVILLLLALVFALPAYWRAHRRFPLPDLRIGVALALLVVWCAIASSWGFDLSRSLVLALRIAVIFAAGLLLFPVAASLDEAARARVGRWLLGGFVLILVLMAVEFGLGFPLLRASEATVPGHEAVWFNRGAVAIALIVWPVTAWLWSRRAGWAALALPLLLGIASFFMESAAATVGFAAGAVAVALVVCHRRIGRAATLAAGVVAFVAMPFAALAMHGGGWHRAGWLMGSAQHRVAIWEFVVERIAEKPLLGWGFDASRHIGAAFGGVGERGRDILPLHPHNAPLQLLLELGAIGALLALGVLCLVALRLDTLPGRTRQCGQALFVATLAVGCLAFGLWQNWWLALIVCVGLLLPLTAGPATRARGA